MAEATPLLPGLSPIWSKSLTAARDAGNLSSNGGLVVLREAARRLDLAAVIADPLPDRRNPLLVIHSYRAMVTARMMAIAAGYEDADDLDALRHDPALMIACERAPETGRSIPSQPTLSHLENLADTRTLYRIGTGFIDLFCRSYARPPASIVLDIDDTDDMVHGQQELALFNTHAGGHGLKPIHIFEAGSGKPILSLLRPGKRPSGEEIARVLAHVIHRIRRQWPQVAILVRGDGHYCAPEVLDLLREKLRLHPRPVAEQDARRPCRALARAVPMALEAGTQGAPLPSIPVCGGVLDAPGEGDRPRRGDRARHRRALHRHEPDGPGQASLREGLLRTRMHGEPDQGPEAQHTLRQDRVLALAGQPVPAVPAHGCLLAPALGADGGTEEVALSPRDLRDHPQCLRKGRGARRGAEALDQARVPAPSELPRVPRRLVSLSQAASAAGSSRAA